VLGYYNYYYESIIITKNESLTAVLHSEDDIGTGAAKVSTYTQRCSQEVLAGFEHMIIWLSRGRLIH